MSMSTATKKRKLRIVFMGTPAFAVAGLQALNNGEHMVVGVITAPDKPAGRGRKLAVSAVKQYALQHKIPILQPTNLKAPEFLESLKALNADLQVVVAFRMLPKVVWQMPAYGTFNLHASLLPQYRGAAPINWAIINGETTTGATTFFIDDKIDTGAIILQKETPIGQEMTAGDLHDTLMSLGASLILDTVALIAEGSVKTIVQANTSDLRPAPKIYKETCEIDWSMSVLDIHNFIRGLSPYPAAWTTLVNASETHTIKIRKASVHSTSNEGPIGTLIVDKSRLLVCVVNGVLELLELQMSGKRSMQVKDLLNGLHIAKDAYVR